jgi:hypothetical protein
MKLKVKTFDGITLQGLERNINEFLSIEENSNTVVDIKYSVACKSMLNGTGDMIYTAMVVQTLPDDTN